MAAGPAGCLAGNRAGGGPVRCGAVSPRDFSLLIKPPSFAELERQHPARRGTRQRPAAFGRRLQRARLELQAEAEFDAVW